jgi:hypothetical protein
LEQEIKEVRKLMFELHKYTEKLMDGAISCEQGIKDLLNKLTQDTKKTYPRSNE